MAFVPTSPTVDPNAPQQPQPGGAPANAPMNLPPAPVTSTVAGGGSGTVGGAPGGGVAAVPNAQTQPPVQNLQDYLAANAPQAAGMGQQIASNLTAGANKVTGDIGADLAAIDQGVQAQNVTSNPTLVSTAAANPSQFVQNPQNLADFLAQENANYTGPTNVESTPQWQTLTTEEQNAMQNAPDVTKPGGFLQLAAGQETNPTAGMTNLDAALLEETPGAAAPILAASAPYANLPGQLSTAATAEDAAINAVKANDAAAAGLIAPAFLTGPNAEVPAWENALTNELLQATGAYNAAGTDINAITSSMNADNLANLTPAQLTELGLTQAQATDLQNLFNTFSGIYGTGGVPNFSTNYTPGQLPAGAPTMAQVATPQDYATEAALSQLLGGRLTSPPITQATVGQAGTAVGPTNPTFNFSGEKGAISTAFQNDDLAKINSYGGSLTLPGNYPLDAPTKAAFTRAYLAGTYNGFGPQYDPYGNNKYIDNFPNPPTPNPAYVQYGSNPGVYQ